MILVCHLLDDSSRWTFPARTRRWVTKAHHTKTWLVLVSALGACAPEPTASGDGILVDTSVSGDTDSHVDESDTPEPTIKPLELVPLTTWGRSSGFGGEGHGLDEFSYPAGIALSPDESELYVFDSNNNRIKAMTLDGRVLRTWSHHPPSTCGDYGSGIAVTPDGTIYIANNKVHGVDGYAPDGTLRYQWQFEGVAGFCTYVGHGHDLVINDDGNVAVTEAGLGQVQVYTPTGDFLFAFGSIGDGKGQFHWGGAGIAFRGDQYVVSDNDQVLLFDTSGNFLREIAPLPEEPFVGVATFAQAWQGWLFLAASDTPATIYAMPPRASLLQYRWQATGGNFPGQLNSPYDVAIDGAGRWFMTELYNHRIQVFQGPRPQ